MEFNARYVLISAFALAVLASLFGFVYWLNNTGGFGKRSQYLVQFSVPVSGLANGSSVLFNGLKVGEVTALQLSRDDPEKLTASISVDADTPIRTDTIAGVDYQGLTGAANISLTGGKAGSTELKTTEGVLPMLIAAPADSRSWTANAARVLSRLDEMLSGDTNRIDSILAGLEKMVGGESDKEGGLFDLASPSNFDFKTGVNEWQLIVSEPTVLLALNTDRIQELKTEISWSPFGSARLTDNLPNLFQAKLIQGFENAGLGARILRPSDVFEAEYKLTMDIRRFHYRSFDEPAVICDVVGKIANRDGAILVTRRFKFERQVKSPDVQVIAEQMSELFSATAAEIITWTNATLDQLP
jgi:phospholipid/cholesterol/gamma-HCH transport system substrate-binding protein